MVTIVSLTGANKRLAARILQPRQLLGSVVNRGVRGGGAALPGVGVDFRSAVWRALHCGYRASSVSTKPTGHVAVRRRPRGR